MSNVSENREPDNINIIDEATDFFNSLSGQLGGEKRKNLFGCIDGLINYDAKIGVLGMTGAGKSSLCNALVGEQIVEVGMVDVCTRNPQEILLVKKEPASVTLVDFPGMGVNLDWTEKDLFELYRDSLRYLDLVLWVLKGDDRAYYDKNLNLCRELFKHTEYRGSLPLIFVISQIDKIEPSKQWNAQKIEPGVEQRKNIKLKLKSVQQQFNLPRTQLCAVSSHESYGLVELIYKIFTNLPNRSTPAINYSELSSSYKTIDANTGIL